MTETASLGLSVDSSGVVSATDNLNEFKDAARGAGAAAGEFGNSTDAAARKAETAANKIRSAYEAARAAIDPMYAASRKYEGSLGALTAAANANIITQTDLVRLNEMAAQKYLASTDGAKKKAAADREAAAAAKEAAAAERQAAAELAKADRAAAAEAKRQAASQAREAARQAAEADRAAAKAAQERAKAERDKQRQIEEANRAQRQTTESYQQLRASVDPAYAATRRYEEAVRQLDAALESNIITQREWHLVHSRLLDAQRQTAALNQNVAKSFSGSSYAMTNFSYQVQDMIVQVASGTDFLRAFAQQAPQALGAFGFSGKLALWGSIGGTVVAGLAAIVPLLLKTGDSAKEAEKRMESLADAVSKYNDLAEKTNMSTTDLVGAFGRFANVRSSFNQSLADIAKSDALDKLEVAVDGFATKYGDLSNKVVYANGYMMKSWEDTAYKIRKDLGITDGQARMVALSLQQLQQAKTLDDKVTSAQSFETSMRNTFGSIDQMPNAIREMVAEALRFGEISSDLAKNWAQIKRDAELNAQFEQMVERANYNRELAIEAAKADDARKEASASIVKEYQDQVALQEAALRYGEESSQVEDLKRQAAMDTAEEYIRQNDLSGQLAQAVRDAAAASWDANAETQAWAVAMARVNAEIQAIARSLAAISGLQIQAAAAKVEAAALARGESLATSARLGVQAERNATYSQRRSQIIAQYTGDYDNPSYKTAIRLLSEEEAAANAAAAAQEKLGVARATAREAEKEGRGGKGGRRRKSDAEREAERDEKKRQQEAERWYERTRTDMERLQDEQKELNDLYHAGYFGKEGSIAALETMSRANQLLLEQYDPLTKAVKEWKNELKQGIVDSIMGANSLSDAMLNVANAILEAAWQATLFGEGPLADMWSGVFGNDGLLGGILNTTPNAKGNVYSSPSLSAYSSTVVSKPTMFAFARGAGIMGEAGPEAIMPLSRGPDGRLGVSAKKETGPVGSSNLAVDLKFDKGDLAVTIRDAMGRVIAQQRQSIIKESIAGSGKAMTTTKAFGGR